jgi:hypothetical protein
MHGLDETNFGALDGGVIEFPVAVGGAVVVTTTFLLLGVWRLLRMDVP